MLNKILKQTIGNKEYSFQMTNKTIRRLEEKYINYGKIIYGLMEGVQYYTNSLKLISLCCIEKDWDIEELEEMLTPQEYQKVTELSAALYMGYMEVGRDVENKKEEGTEKNIETQP